MELNDLITSISKNELRGYPGGRTMKLALEAPLHKKKKKNYWGGQHKIKHKFSKFLGGFRKGCPGTAFIALIPQGSF